ncbi:type II toxin-antitoxin system RelE/ParE family toxin [Tundrisphaera sp. TA3]|uniref:type II toxin-antitoxin system RelE/ParE family toxin n=1 Tax=Tundrisphaera sp. TA3 TaxID=3435775 RepID=UPI003EB6C7C4
MTYRVILQPQAERDIRDAARWILDHSKSSAPALRWVRSIRSRIDTLKSTPFRCPVDPDSEDYGTEVRVLLHGGKRGRYRILFAIRDDAVIVLTVRHAARQSPGDEPE